MNEIGLAPAQSEIAFNEAVGQLPTHSGYIDSGIQEPTNNVIRDVHIERLSSGYLVNVGCQRVAVETTNKLITMLGKYYENPKEFEKQWYSQDVVNRLDNIK